MERMNESEYERLKEEAVEALIKGPQETYLKMMEKEREYKKAFDKVLKRDGVVTGESLAKELNKSNSSTMVKPRIYISGPISGHDMKERRAEFKRVQILLEAEDWEVFNPMENGLPAEANTHQHMQRDLSVLTSEEKPFDAIYMMKKWLHSKGCKLEFDVATAIGLDVYFEESKTMIKFT